MQLITVIITSSLLFSSTAGAVEFVNESLEVGGDTVIFVAQIPDGYNPESSSAIVVAWHSWGNNQYEIFDNTEFDDEANRRGWILTSHYGPGSIHWNNHDAQRHCDIMLDWLFENYPYDPDSIYMIGGSMGGAAGQVWHVNNCGSNDHLIAATAGGSQILDTQLRAIQYLAEGDTNRSMRDLFGGLPGFSDSVDYEYHRASAVYLADTTESLHFNSLTLPVWNRWGSSDLEVYAYGYPARVYERLRTGATELTAFAPSDIANHGLLIMWPEGVCNWLSRFSVNRYPDTISIAADEADDYYYSYVELGSRPFTFGRYGVWKSEADRRLDISLIRNIQEITVRFEFPWSRYDTLWGEWSNEDGTITNPVVHLQDIPRVLEAYRSDGSPFQYVMQEDELVITLAENGEYVIVFEPTFAREPPRSIAVQYRLLNSYPNPFNASTTLQIESPRSASKQILFYDIQGRIVKKLNVQLSPGVNQLPFEGEGLSTGIYFAVMEGETLTPLKLMLLK
ncbi:T9SS type A sorting domain-containing protein [bacterium]|nr:T9SS type A sorting domain-containing protein [bacterium]